MNFDDYENKLSYPEPFSRFFNCPNCGTILDKKEVKFCSNCGINVVDYISKQEGIYKSKKEEYNTESLMLENQFWDDLLYFCGYSKNSVIKIPVEKIMAYAWERGYSEGYRAIASVFEKITDLEGEDS